MKIGTTEHHQVYQYMHPRDPKREGKRGEKKIIQIHNGWKLPWPGKRNRYETPGSPKSSILHHKKIQNNVNPTCVRPSYKLIGTWIHLWFQCKTEHLKDLKCRNFEEKNFWLHPQRGNR